MSIIKEYKIKKENLMESLDFPCLLIDALINNANFYLELALFNNNKKAVDFLKEEISFFEKLNEKSWKASINLTLIEAGLL